MKIREVHLKTDILYELHEFYSKTLDIQLEESNTDYFSIKTGKSLLKFSWGEPQGGYYHFAFNIPSFQSRQALNWLKERVEVLKYGETEIHDFSNWNAEAIYFQDPAGNIVECIARKNLNIRTDENFHPGQLQCISEVGIPVASVRELFKKLHKECGISLYWGDLKRFCAAGDEQGLFIIVDESEKIWYPTEKPARSFPLSIEFESENKIYHLETDGMGKVLVHQGEPDSVFI